MTENYISLKNPIGRENYNELRVSVSYQKPQINYFNGRNEGGGIYVYIKPIKRTHGIISCTMLSTSTLENGFKIRAVEMSRNNKKKVEHFGDLITDKVLETIREYYEAQTFSKIAELITELSLTFK